MIGLGTVINTAAVAAGCLVGLLFKKGIKASLQKTLTSACGVATIFIGGSGVFAAMLRPTQNGLEASGAMMLIISLVLGGLLGEAIDIEGKMEGLGEKIKSSVGKGEDGKFTEGFVGLSLVICVGAMAIVGSIQDGVSGDFSLLLSKSVLDFIISIVFASAFGVGTVFSAGAIFVYQGLITALAAFFGSFMSSSVIDALSFVGSALIFCVGVNLVLGKKIKVGNLLPALVFGAVYALIFP